MPRNLERRVEILFPIEDNELKQRIVHILECELKDNAKAHILSKNGEYIKPEVKKKKVCNSQETFVKEAINSVKETNPFGPGDYMVTRRFTVESSSEKR